MIVIDLETNSLQARHARWVRTIDGDTVVIDVGGRAVHVRLLDCWAAPLAVPEGRAAAKALDGLLEETADQTLSVWAPLPIDKDGDGTVGITEAIRQLFSFGRLLGRLSIGEIDVQEWLIARGHAYPTKSQLAEALTADPRDR